MASWRNRYAVLSVRQLSILWFVLAISPNLNLAQSAWVLLIVYVLLYGAVTGFEQLLKSQKTVKTGIGIAVAGLYTLGIVLSAFKISLLFSILIAFYGIAYATVHILSRNANLPRIIGTSILEGLGSFIIIFAGVSGFAIERALAPGVLIPGIIATTTLISIDLAKGQPVPTLRYFALSGLLIASAVAFIVYITVYLNSVYWWPVLALTLVPIAVYFAGPFLVVSRYRSWSLKEGVLFWVYLLLLNVYFFYVFTEHTHILQLI